MPCPQGSPEDTETLAPGPWSSVALDQRAWPDSSSRPFEANKGNVLRHPVVPFHWRSELRRIDTPPQELGVLPGHGCSCLRGKSGIAFWKDAACIWSTSKWLRAGRLSKSPSNHLTVVFCLCWRCQWWKYTGTCVGCIFISAHTHAQKSPDLPDLHHGSWPPTLLTAWRAKTFFRTSVPQETGRISEPLMEAIRNIPVGCTHGLSSKFSVCRCSSLAALFNGWLASLLATTHQGRLSPTSKCNNEGQHQISLQGSSGETACPEQADVDSWGCFAGQTRQKCCCLGKWFPQTPKVGNHNHSHFSLTSDKKKRRPVSPSNCNLFFKCFAQRDSWKPLFRKRREYKRNGTARDDGVGIFDVSQPCVSWSSTASKKQ